MQQTKYDYNALKLEYFKSEIDEIKSFRLDKGLTYSSRTREMTKWRWQEKQKRKDAIIEKALERQKNQIAKKLEIPVEDLFKTKKQAIELMKYKLNQYAKKVNKAQEDGDDEDVAINMKDLEKIRKVAKVELGEPTIVAKNEWKTTLETSWPLVAIVRSEENDDENEEDDDE